MSLKGLFDRGALLATGLIMVACGSDLQTHSTVDVRNAELSHHNNVTIFYSQDGRCTASYINESPPVMLTARHCVERSWKEHTGEVPQGNRAKFVFEDQGQEIEINADRYYYAEKKFYEIGILIIPNDFALLRLEDTPPAHIKVNELADTKPRLGDKMRVVGYGQSDCVVIIKGKDMEPVQREKEYTWGLNYNVCPGDSGGPHFNAEGQIAAVSSAVSLIGEIHAKIAPHVEHIERVIREW